jgi:hypothetical protein
MKPIEQGKEKPEFSMTLVFTKTEQEKRVNLRTRTCFDSALSPKSDTLRVPFASRRRFSG